MPRRRWAWRKQDALIEPRRVREIGGGHAGGGLPNQAESEWELALEARAEAGGTTSTEFERYEEPNPPRTGRTPVDETASCEVETPSGAGVLHLAARGALALCLISARDRQQSRRFSPQIPLGPVLGREERAPQPLFKVPPKRRDQRFPYPGGLQCERERPAEADLSLPESHYCCRLNQVPPGPV